METTIDYDAMGNLASVTRAVGSSARTTSFTTTPEGYLDTTTDGAGRISDVDYDAMGRIVGITEPGNRLTTFAYENGKRSSVTPPGRPPHGFNYTPADLFETYAPPSVGDPSKDTAYDYTPGHRPMSVAPPDGQDILRQYDGGGRPSQVTVPRGDFIFTRAPAGAGADDGGHVVSILTPEGQLIEPQYQAGEAVGWVWSGLLNGSYGRGFDVGGRLASESVNGIPIASFVRDNDSLLLSAGELSVVRDPTTGQRLSSTLRSLADTYEYDPFGSLETYSLSHIGNVLYDVRYQRDELGRVVNAAEAILGNTTVYAYGYDTAGRLMDVTEDGVLVRSYAYDVNGNRTALTTPTETVPITYDEQDRILTSGSISYAHSSDGNRTTRLDTVTGDASNYSYGAGRTLLSVERPDGVLVEYLTDGVRRIAKSVNGTRAQGFLYRGPLFMPIAQLDASDAVVSTFVYGEGGVAPAYVSQGGSVYRLVKDQIGSVRLVVNADTGGVVQRIDYDEFGRVLEDTNPGFQPFGFAGGLYDSDTGLTRLGVRDYDAEIGRWTTKDRSRFGGGDTNLFAYAANDPVNRVDTNGLQASSAGTGATDPTGGLDCISTPGGGIECSEPEGKCDAPEEPEEECDLGETSYGWQKYCDTDEGICVTKCVETMMGSVEMRTCCNHDGSVCFLTVDTSFQGCWAETPDPPDEPEPVRCEGVPPEWCASCDDSEEDHDCY